MLVPIAILAYFHDIPDWVSTLYSAHILGFLAAAVALFVLGLWLKRGIVGAYLEMSQGSSVLGIVFLSAAVGFYIYGSWYGLTSWFHFESLLLLAVSYGFFLLDTRFMRLTAPLLAIFAFVLPIPFVQLLQLPFVQSLRLPFVDALAKQPYFLLYIPAVFVVLFASYVRTPKAMILPALVAATGALYWLYPAYWPLAGLPLAGVPLLCLALLAPKRLRMNEQLPSGGSLLCALHGEPETLVGGFCSMCGRKRAAIRQVHFGAIGLVLVLLTLFALAVTQVPVLSLNGSIPSSNVYSPTGVTSAQIPPAPAGWLANSSTLLHQKGDAYAVKQVYVPSYHPETENYTLYYELSSNGTVITNSWQGMPGWTQNSSVSSVLPLQGRLITYTSPGVVKLVFVGTTVMYFSNGTGFEPLAVGYSVTREFRGTPVQSATSQFTSDLQALFQPALDSEIYYSVWTSYFFRVSQTAAAVEGLLALVSSGGLIFWGAYRFELSDSKSDAFMTAASGIDDEDYSLLASQLEAGQSNRTGNEIALMAGVDAEDKQMLRWIHSSLQKLEGKGLMKMTLVEKGSDLILAWKVPV